MQICFNNLEKIENLEECLDEYLDLELFGSPLVFRQHFPKRPLFERTR